MTGEEYLARLGQLVAQHPGARVIATDYGDDYSEGGDYDACPFWSERDQVINADGSEADEDALSELHGDPDALVDP